ncbi:CwfJ domain protein [Aspergillus novofumigatus IBT 16806]|uniref:CwfJ domain protein n=1 Tax=Aspergillus novofumigatus (strain IBT 16806) TaxID=1392255 RepID=A0A2I1CD50_ASPN1|nr:CwfJ domain protein [Aspergillus novofumigatus IBT 16806]PKX95550.1 CwfJ domain protein [Aspergillus novofumigatus IBT 16806]
MASKIVVIGSVNCELREVFTKLAKLHVKQNFSIAIIVGDLFGDCSTEHELDEITALLQGNINVPLPTYFGLGNRPLPTRIVERIEANDEVCPNLYFLGKRGTLKTAEGIRLVALGGNLETDSKATNKFHPGYTESDARALYGAHSADILITHQWPKGIRTGSNAPLPEDAKVPEEVQCIADLCSTLKPRYHVSSSDGFFYEREPFFHMPSEDYPDAKPLTRFISPPPLTIPVGATATPLAPIQVKRKVLPSQRESYHRFAGTEEDHSRPRKRARAPPPGPEQCFFCLSNPNIATHLITSIGNESYLTTAKGPLTTAKTITDQTARQSTYAEMQRYRSALHAMLQQRSNGGLGAVTWEVSRGTGIHIHWQFLPVPADLIKRGLVDAAFRVEAENLNYPKFERPSASADPSSEPGDFFRLWIWEPQNPDGSDGATTKGAENTLLLPLGPEFRFDIQFGRRVMAKLMELENRMNWKDGVQPQEEEEADAAAFKEAFKEFDFSLQE